MKEDFIKSNICKSISCDECREKFKMPYGECCLFCCDCRAILCNKCSSGVYNKKILNDIIKYENCNPRSMEL